MGRRTFVREPKRQPKPETTRLPEARRFAEQTPPIQAKLTVGPANDQFEQEADRIAKQVVQRTTVAPTSEEEAPLMVQRKPVGAGGGPASPEMTAQIDQARSGGQALAPEVQGRMESAFGADFSGVRVHTNNQADQLNRSLSARAFTTGNDVFFRSGEYNPASSSGQELIAHELTHVVQQGAASPSVQRDLIQRAMTPQNPNWGEATSAKALQAGRSNLGIFEFINGNNKIVVKFTNEELSPATSFGDRVLEAVGIANPDSVPVSNGQPHFNAALQTLQQLIVTMRNDGNSADADGIETLLNLRNPQQASSMLIMRNVDGVDFGNHVTAQSPAIDDTHETKVRATELGGDPQFQLVNQIINPVFLHNLGKMAVADAFMGNQDRLSIDAKKKPNDPTYATFNGSNFKLMANNAIGGFDHDTHLMGRDFYAQATGKGDPDAWFNVLINGETYAEAIGERPVPALGALFTTAGQQAIHKQMCALLGSDLSQGDKQRVVNEFTFAHFQTNFQRGIQAGLVAIAAQADQLRQAAQQLGHDDNLDSEALDVRLEFIKTKAAEVNGKQGVALDTAMNNNTNATANAKALADVLALASGAPLRTDPGLLPLPQNPNRANTGDKVGRFFTRKGTSQQSTTAKNLRKEAQKATVNQNLMNDLDNQVNNLTHDDRRVDKAKFHLKLLQAVRSMEDHATLLTKYSDVVSNYDTLPNSAKQKLVAALPTITQRATLAIQTYQQVHDGYEQGLTSKKDVNQRQRLETAFDHVRLPLDLLVVAAQYIN